MEQLAARRNFAAIRSEARSAARNCLSMRNCRCNGSRVGADLVAVHGLGSRGLSAGVTIVADGKPVTAERLKRVLDGDPGIGVLCYATPATDEQPEGARAASVTSATADRTSRPYVKLLFGSMALKPTFVSPATSCVLKCRWAARNDRVTALMILQP